MSGEGEGFLSRWSRRKREAAAAPEPLPGPLPDPLPDPLAGPLPEPSLGPPPEAAGAPVAEPPPEAEPGSPPVLARPACPIAQVPEIDPATLPRIEELTLQSDLGAFLRPGVPQALRNAALRRMWSLDPAIRDYIGPVDYQWDFNTPGGLPFGFSNELGGDVAKLLAQAIGQLTEDRPEAEAAEQAEAPPALDAPPAEPSSVAEAVLPEPEAEREPPEALPEPRLVAEPATPPVARRRHGSALPS